MKVEVADLKEIRFFEKFTEAQLEKIASFSSTKDFKVKEIIFEQYDELTDVFILLQGLLTIGISLPDNKRINLGTIEEGQLFSWSAVFPPYISTAWVMTATPARVIAIDGKKLNEEIERDCSFGLKTMTKIAQTISHRLTDTRLQLMNQLNL